uniref:Uncharacterized protein n=1 Tax=Klebsiella pneumoniae TaxID=573 RepID=A0A6M6A474_KLEPN|nr:hypothetical protein [Klebsiella pneumoniae]QJX13326.1 hypothetical protein [Klebsiella pneumoniae]QJX13458.1 hypothetical protein [Klebsiella pneumoniae]
MKSGIWGWEDQRYHATGADTTYGGDNTLEYGIYRKSY